MIAAQTTDTGTLTVTSRVEVAMNGYRMDLAADNASHTRWRGELWDESFEKLPDGPLTFTFKATYNNGTVKTTTVIVKMAGNVQQVYGVFHRRN